MSHCCDSCGNKKFKIVPGKCNKCGSIDIKWTNKCGQRFKTQLVADPDLERAMELLFETFQIVDDAFNTRGGLTPEEIAELGYFGDLTTVLAMGPFPDCHDGHTNVAGVFQAFGTMESSITQFIFEGGLLMDPNFPYNDHVTYTDAPKLFHSFPIVTSYLGNNQFTVTATALVHYSGPDIPATEESPVVARIGSIAQYSFQCDPATGEIIVPMIVWINFTIVYLDCPPEEQERSSSSSSSLKKTIAKKYADIVAHRLK